MQQLLAGKTVLVAEDEYLLAAMLTEALEGHGAQVIGPWPNISEALESIAELRPDVALLDLNLRGELIYPVADRLTELHVPMVLVTGYDRELIPSPYAALPFCRKPLTLAELIDMLQSELARSHSQAAMARETRH